MFLGNDLEIRTLEWSSVSLSFQRSTTRFPGTIPASWDTCKNDRLPLSLFNDQQRVF
jgi:hypothetical protein